MGPSSRAGFPGRISIQHRLYSANYQPRSLQRSCREVNHRARENSAKNIRRGFGHAGTSQNNRKRCWQRVKAADSQSAALDRTIEIKIAIAKGTDKLDLSDLASPLNAIPAEVFDLENLTELSLAGNNLTAIPPAIGRLRNLERLQVSGNSLSQLPEEIGELRCLEGLWAHGNQIEALPGRICNLTNLKVLMLAGNRLERLPDDIGNLSALEDLGVPGNLLETLPESIGNLKGLRKLSLHGNRIKHLPSSFGSMDALTELWLMGNDLTTLPDSICNLRSLEQLSVADNNLSCLPTHLSSLIGLTSIWLYGNRIADIPHGLSLLPQLRHFWLEGNPLSVQCVTKLLSEAPRCPSLKAIGLDRSQVVGVSQEIINVTAQHEILEVSSIAAVPADSTSRHSSTRGYFKLVHGTQFQKEGSPRVLAIAFGSAPGVPNWAGLLKRVGAEAKKAIAGRFDVLYVVDPCRSWYGGGEQQARNQFRTRLQESIQGYDEVVMIGDSMGATAALLFSDLATHVHSFCPQIDLQHASIRPGEPPEWHKHLKEALMESVARSTAKICVHCGNWKHDLDQAVLVEKYSELLVYDVHSHRLALQLDSQKRLLPIIRDTLFSAMRAKPTIRLSNLL